MEAQMKCVACGSSMKKTRGDYAYTSLPGVTLRDVEIWRCPECDEEEVLIPRIEALNLAIAGGLVRKHGRLVPTEVRFLRKLLGWSGVDFARHFGVTPETVSRWESGKKQMGPVAERLLRLCTATQAPVEDYGVGDLQSVEETDQPSVMTLKTTSRGWKSVAA
jgi:putative transcriptional regulator